MCQTERAASRAVIDRQSSLDAVELAKRKLNPTALNFISSRSSSEINSPEARPASEAGSEEGQAIDLVAKGEAAHPEHIYYNNGPSHEEGAAYHHNEYAHWGWESPQVRTFAALTSIGDLRHASLKPKTIFLLLKPVF